MLAAFPASRLFYQYLCRTKSLHTCRGPSHTEADLSIICRLHTRIGGTSGPCFGVTSETLRNQISIYRKIKNLALRILIRNPHHRRIITKSKDDMQLDLLVGDSSWERAVPSGRSIHLYFLVCRAKMDFAFVHWAVQRTLRPEGSAARGHM